MEIVKKQAIVQRCLERTTESFELLSVALLDEVHVFGQVLALLINCFSGRCFEGGLQETMVQKLRRTEKALPPSGPVAGGLELVLEGWVDGVEVPPVRVPIFGNHIAVNKIRQRFIEPNQTTR